MSTVTRDLEADLAICEAATPGPWVVALKDCVVRDYWEVDGSRQVVLSAANDIEADAHFAAEARQGWPYAIQRAQEAEQEVDRLRNELEILQEQLSQQHRSPCYD